MKTIVKILSLAGAIILIMACSKSDPFYGDENSFNENSAAEKYVAGTIYQLEGASLYKTWAVTDGTVLQDASYDNVGVIEFLGGRDFKFCFQEIREGGNAAEFYGKISASGGLSFQFPAPLFTSPDGTPIYILDIIKSHGCVTDLWGPGINKGTLYFNGRFDGTSLYAETKFKANVIDKCPELFSYNGIVHFVWAYDMHVTSFTK
jgi:hypothetical protein